MIHDDDGLLYDDYEARQNKWLNSKAARIAYIHGLDECEIPYASPDVLVSFGDWAASMLADDAFNEWLER